MRAACASLDCTAAIVDGEAVILDAQGTSNFQALQGSFGRDRPDLFFVGFDLLYLDGWDLRSCTLLQRKELLRELIPTEPGTLRFSGHIVGQGEQMFAEACRMKAEGIVCKRASSHYHSGRTRDWVKVKCFRRQEFVIVGFSDPSRSRAGIGSLLVGAYDASGSLVFCGKVGTGFSARTLVELRGMLEPLERAQPAVINPPRGAAGRDVHWVEPRAIAEVSFTEWTAEGLIRHSSFQGLRRDKSPEEVQIER